jgi:hypothetical protein
MTHCKFLLVFLTACILGAVFYTVPFYDRSSTSPRIVVNATMNVFSDLSTLAKQFPRFDPLIDGVSELRMAMRDTSTQFRHSELPAGCKKDVALLLQTTAETIITITDSLTTLNVQSPYAMYKFIQINIRLLNEPYTAYEPAMHALLEELNGLAQHTRRLLARYKLVSALLAGSDDICTGISRTTGQSGFMRLWHWLFDGHMHVELLEKDLALFAHFADAQGEQQQMLGQMQTVIEAYLDIVQKLYKAARHSLINIPEDRYVQDLEQTIVDLRQMFSEYIKM